MSSLAFLLNLAGLGIFGYSTYYMNYNPNLEKLIELQPPKLRGYGLLRLLTYQCLLIQLINTILHLGSYLTHKLIKARDLWFSALAYPVGSLVVYTFWGVWLFMGREMILPVEVSKYNPSWLNHATHSIIAPVNILMALLVPHNYSSKGFLLTLLHVGLYMIYLNYIKFQSGLYVYKFLDTFSKPKLILFFACLGLLTYLLYKSGQLLSDLMHNKQSRKSKKASKRN